MGRLLLFACFILTTLNLSAQANYSLVVGIGGNSYSGDLNIQPANPQMNITIGVDSYLEQRLFIRGSLNYGMIEANYEPGDAIVDPTDKGPDFIVTNYFSSQLLSLETAAMFEFISGGFLSITGGVGIGALYFDPRDSNGNKLSSNSNTRLPDESYSSVVPYSPVTLSIILFGSRKVNLMFENTWLFTNSDYIDNIGYAGDTGSDYIVRQSFLMRYNF